MTIYLNAISASFYRGIGERKVKVLPLSDINFFIGENNSGKSTILNLINSHIPRPEIIGSEVSQLEKHEEYLGEEGSFSVDYGVPTEHVISKAKNYFENELKINYQIYQEDLECIINLLSIDGCLWGKYLVGRYFSLSLDRIELLRIALKINENKWQNLFKVIASSSGGTLHEDWVPEVTSWIATMVEKTHPISMMIPAKRALGGNDETFDDLTGKGLLGYLAKIQNPPYYEQDKKRKFESINDFIRSVTGKEDATLEVPANREHLLVRIDNKVLPIQALGTGIHETVLIASFCTIHQKQIMCIEEPEVHLHPILQRKLIKYLADKTENQYFIATHSASLIDHPAASIFHVSNDGMQTYVRHVMSNDQRNNLLDELGYRASDILQTNYIVWVEGPSDRIYLRHWIQSKDPNLIEGIHYTIMFYGGSLIKHLSASDDSVSEFINLLKLNRNCAVILDSDKDSENAKLKESASRIKGEMESASRIAWITEGREIENYIKHDILQAALRNLHPIVYGEKLRGGKFDHAFYFYRKLESGSAKEVFKHGDKVGAASIVCNEKADLSILDLDERVTELVKAINKSNGLWF